MIKQRITKIICLILSISLCINTCNAANIDFLGTIISNTGSGGNSGGTVEDPLEGKSVDKGLKTYRYEYQEGLYPSSNTTINAYNLEGESVIPNRVTIDPNTYKFKAGTWIGINVTENHSVKWSVDQFKVYEKRKKHNCSYSRTGYYWPDEYWLDGVMTKAQCDYKYYAWSYDENTNQCYYRCCWYEGGTISAPEVDTDYNEEYTCPSTYLGYGNMVQTTTSYETEIRSGSIYNELKRTAITEVKEKARRIMWGSSGVVKYIKDNSYDEDNLHYNEITDSNPTDLTETPISETSGMFERSHEFLEKVCMNIKTSKVTYGDECKPNPSQGIIEIENKKIYDEHIRQANKWVTYWHYFIPLDATSDTLFTLDVIGNENKSYSVDECEAFIKEKIAAGDDYQNYIAPVSKNDSFDGSYKRNQQFSEDYTKLKKGNGCYISTKIYFPISQEFYNEVKDTSTNKITFNGFNFYYKPIDASSIDKNTDQTEIIFPNSVPTVTLWDDWYTAKKKNKTTSPDLSNSYTNLTYYASNISAKKVRDYNSTHTYTTWGNMNTTGLSQFIEKEGIVKRISTQEVYKLGCGPANANKKLPDGTTNNLYIKGCELS